EHTAGLDGQSAHRIAEAAVASFETGVQWAAGAAVVLVVIAALLTSFGLKGAGRLLPGAAEQEAHRDRDWHPRSSPRAAVESWPVRYLRDGLNERRGGSLVPVRRPATPPQRPHLEPASAACAPAPGRRRCRRARR